MFTCLLLVCFNVLMVVGYITRLLCLVWLALCLVVWTFRIAIGGWLLWLWLIVVYCGCWLYCWVLRLVDVFRLLFFVVWWLWFGSFVVFVVLLLMYLWVLSLHLLLWCVIVLLYSFRYFRYDCWWIWLLQLYARFTGLGCLLGFVCCCCVLIMYLFNSVV